MEEELLCLMALTEIPGLGSVGIRNLLTVVGDATTVFRERTHLTDYIPKLNPRIIAALDAPEAFKIAEKEMRFVESNHIRCLTLQSEDYPSRLRECDDAPFLLFYRGNADLNALRVINMVGTRHATDYGKGICASFLADLKTLVPDVLVVSGLAYGIDINAHRAALANQLDTVGVLAHGLDRIYPVVHRNTAAEMVSHGGLLTEYKSGTNPDRQNFVCRNRIVAGIADATIVVESAEKGGSLITAEIAESYHRDCFAFPGRTDDLYSKGCNALIASNRAALIQSAEDFVKAMCWETASVNKSPEAVQRQLFPNLTDEEQIVVGLLQSNGDLQINTLVVQANIPVYKMSAILFELEMKGVVRALAGGVYHLLG